MLRGITTGVIMRRLRWVGILVLLCWMVFWLFVSAAAYKRSRETLAQVESQPREIQSFSIRVDGQRVFLRNTSQYTLTTGDIEYEAELDNGQYISREWF